MKHILFIGLLFLVSCGYNTKQVEETVNSSSPQEVEKDVSADSALAFVNTYINRSPESGNIIEWVGATEMVTESFRAELKKVIDEAYKEDPEMGLSFDPILNAQDIPDEGFVVDSVDNKTSYIFLKGKDQEQFKVIVKMKKIDNKWFVDGCGIINIPTIIYDKN